MIILLTAIIFFIIGRISYTARSKEKKTIDDIVDRAREIMPEIRTRRSPGTIPFKTPEDFELERSGDKALAKHWEESGIGDLVRKQ